MLRIALSGKFSRDHFDTGFAVSATLRDIIEAAGLEAVDTDLEGLVFFPVIISDEFGIERKSHRSYSRKERSEFVNVEIDANIWSTANQWQRLRIMMDALEEAVRSTRSDRINNEAKSVIISRLRSALEASDG